MMTIKAKITTLVFAGLLLLAGCAQPTPVVIYVTPTPQDAATAEGTTAETAVAGVPTDSPETDEPEADTVTPGPTVTFMGSIVDGSYELPPTETPRPTNTPEGGIPTATPTPTLEPEEPTNVPGSPTPRPSPTGTQMPALDMSDIGIQSIELLALDDSQEVVKQVRNDMQFGWFKVQIAWDRYQPNGPGEVNEALRRIEIFLEQMKIIMASMS